MINPFLTNPPNLSALKTPENQRFSVILTGNTWYLLDKLQKRNVVCLSIFYMYYFRRCLSELAQLVPLPYS